MGCPLQYRRAGWPLPSGRSQYRRPHRFVIPIPRKRERVLPTGARGHAGEGRLIALEVDHTRIRRVRRGKGLASYLLIENMEIIEHV